jgi:hypothetical protein
MKRDSIPAAVLAFAFFLPVQNASAAVPGQYIAKLYTEGLGRAPDPSGWFWRNLYFAQQGCNVTTLYNQAVEVFTSAEFRGLGYDNAEKILAIYRGVLSREPDPSGFNSRKAILDQCNRPQGCGRRLFRQSGRHDSKSTAGGAHQSFAAQLQRIQSSIQSTLHLVDAAL